MKWLIVLSLTLLAARVTAATAYVSDELVLGVYSELNNQGQRLTTLHSGARVETLAVSGDFTQVRLNDATVGWVKSAYLTTEEPAVVRIKQLQDELDRSRATTPALAEAAARSELEQLKRELAAKQAELVAAQAALTPPGGSGSSSGSPRPVSRHYRDSHPPDSPPSTPSFAASCGSVGPTTYLNDTPPVGGAGPTYHPGTL